jgi:hypothetical protein
MQHRERGDRAGTYNRKDYRPNRMQHGGEPRRHQRMHHAQRPELDKTGRNLRRSDQGGGGNRARRAGAGDFEEARQVRGQSPL